MIDSLIAFQEKARKRADESRLFEKLNLLDSKGERIDYAVLTMHRPSNVDARETFEPLARVLTEINAEIPVVFPVHPRTRGRIDEFNLQQYFSQLRLSEPLTYLEMLALTSGSSLVITDSGGLQEETTYLQIPCLTIRPNTERPVTISEGTNVLVSPDPEKIMKEFKRVMQDRGSRKSKTPAYWDGKTAERIIEILVKNLTK